MQLKSILLIALFLFSVFAQEELHGARNINRGYDFHQGGQVPIDKVKKNQNKKFKTFFRQKHQFMHTIILELQELIHLLEELI